MVIFYQRMQTVLGTESSVCLVEVSFVLWFIIVDVMNEGSNILVSVRACECHFFSVCSEFCQQWNASFFGCWTFPSWLFVLCLKKQTCIFHTLFLIFMLQYICTIFPEGIKKGSCGTVVYVTKYIVIYIKKIQDSVFLFSPRCGLSMWCTVKSVEQLYVILLCNECISFVQYSVFKTLQHRKKHLNYGSKCLYDAHPHHGISLQRSFYFNRIKMDSGDISQTIILL